jgi:antitoxin VapB
MSAKTISGFGRNAGFQPANGGHKTLLISSGSNRGGLNETIILFVLLFAGWKPALPPFCPPFALVPATEFLLTMYIHVVYTILMHTTKIFKSGNSQAVRLPKEFQFDSTEVEIFRRGDEVVLRKKAANLVRAYELLTQLPGDFLQKGRGEDLPQEREDL